MNLLQSLGRVLLSSSEGHEPTPEAETAIVCHGASYEHRIDNPEGFNFCLVPDGGPDAVFFAGMAILAISVASPRWDAIVVLALGAIYEVFAFQFNLGHFSNASALWLGMRPADIFVYVFLPPFLLDLAVRIDFYLFKKVLPNVLHMAFVMVIVSTMVFIPFMLYGLKLEDSGWTASYVALFGAVIGSTDAAAVAAALNAGGGPEILAILLEGESLFNDASSLTLFEIFKELIEEDANHPLGQTIQDVVVGTIKAALTGTAVGIAVGIFNHVTFVWLQWRNMPASAEVAFTVGGGYVSFYIAQVWCHASGCVATVAYGLYGASTLLFGMSMKARASGIFAKFWEVMIFVINGLIFFYVGASCVNFTWRASEDLYEDGGLGGLFVTIWYKLPLIWLVSFSMRGVMLYIGFKALYYMKITTENFSWQEVSFVTIGGLRGSLSLVLAAATFFIESPNPEASHVRAEIAIYTAGFVIMTLLINAPLAAPIMTLLKLDAISPESMIMRKQVKGSFLTFTASSLQTMKEEQDENEMLQGVDWEVVESQTDHRESLHKMLPEESPRINWRIFLKPFTCVTCFLCRDNLTEGCRWMCRKWGKSGDGANADEAYVNQYLDKIQVPASKEMSRNSVPNKALLQATVFDTPIDSQESPFRASFSVVSGVLIIGDHTQAPVAMRKALSRRHTNGQTGELQASAQNKPSRKTGKEAKKQKKQGLFSYLGLKPPIYATEEDAAPHKPSSLYKGRKSMNAATALKAEASQKEEGSERPLALTRPSKKGLLVSSASKRHSSQELPADVGPTSPKSPTPQLAAPPTATSGAPTIGLATNVVAPATNGNLPNPEDSNMDVELAPLGAGTAAAAAAAGGSTAHAHPRGGQVEGSSSNKPPPAPPAPTPPPPAPPPAPSASQGGSPSAAAPIISPFSVDNKTERDVGSPGLRKVDNKPLLVIKPSGAGSTAAPSNESLRLVQGKDGEVQPVNVMGRPLGRGSFNLPGSGTINPLGRGSLPQAAVYQFESPPGHEMDGIGQSRGDGMPVFESPPGHELDGIGQSRGQGQGRANKSNLGSRSVGMAAASSSQHAPRGERPIGRSSVGFGPAGLGVGDASNNNSRNLRDSRTERPLGAGSMSVAAERALAAMEGPVRAKGISPSSTVLQDKPGERERPLGTVSQRGERPLGTVSQRGERSPGTISQRGERPLGTFSQRGERSLGTLSQRGEQAVGATSHVVPLGQSRMSNAAVVTQGPGGGLVRRSTNKSLARNSMGGTAGGELPCGFNVDDELMAKVAANDVESQVSLDSQDHHMLSEFRMRLLTGLKQYYKGKFVEGVLSAQPYKTLTFCCDAAHHHPHGHIKLWERARKEIDSHGVVKWESKAAHKMKSWDMAAKAGKFGRIASWTLPPLLFLPLTLLNMHLDSVRLVALETAVELWISLTTSLQTQWLEYSGAYGAMLLDEVQQSADAAWEHIVERRIEMPETFQAIQTYRASVSVLSQQRSFILEMSEGGMIEEKESKRITEIIGKRFQTVVRAGPQWQRQSVNAILSGASFLRGCSPKVIEWVRRNCKLKSLKPGEVIWEKAATGEEYKGKDGESVGDAPCVFIVVSGVVRMMLEMENHLVPMYLGSGGVGGIVNTVLQEYVPGVSMCSATAEGNSFGRGPVVLRIPHEVFAAVRHFSRDEKIHVYQTLELNLHRAAASHVLDLLRGMVTSQLGLFIRDTMVGVMTGEGRLESMLAKRQRLRVLLREGVHAMGLDGEAGVGMQLDWIGELLKMNDEDAKALLEEGELADALLEDMENGSLFPWHEMMFKAIAAATNSVYDTIKTSVKESWMMVVQPYEMVVQTSTMVLIQGSLNSVDTGDAKSFPSAPNLGRLNTLSEEPSMEFSAHSEYPAPSVTLPPRPVSSFQPHARQMVASLNDNHVAPSVMVWTSDYFEGEQAPDPVKVMAGPKGATLMVWGTDAQAMIVRKPLPPTIQE